MELKEKIELVENFKNDQIKLKEKLAEAEKNNDSSEIQRINEEIKNIISKIKDVNEKFQTQMEERPIEDKVKEETTAFLEKGNEIDDKIDEYTDILANVNLSNEDKIIAQEKLEKLNFSKNKLRGEIYGVALEKSGLNYDNGEISTLAVIKKYAKNVEELRKEKENLEKQKVKQKEIIKQKKSDMSLQLDIAIEKYREMLQNGKISPEVYEKRVVSMREAKQKDEKILDKSLENFDLKLEENSEKMIEAEKYIDEYQSKFKIYDEYDKVYYKLFGEPLDKFAKERNKIMQESARNSGYNVKSQKEANSIPNNDEIAENVQVPRKSINNDNSFVQKGSSSADMQPDKNQKVAEILPQEIVVTSKTMFNKLYKKLSEGNISDLELSALSKVLENEENYDKYGITTGLIFNKAKKILKAQGVRTAENVEKFLATSGKFFPDVEFNTEIEGEDVLSHDLFNSWKEISKQFAFTEKDLSVERYINEMEKYKEEGNTLTKEQEKIYEEAIKIKDKIAGYKKAVNANEKVAVDRALKRQNFALYGMFKNKFGKDKIEALPKEINNVENTNKIMSDEVLDLSQMVNISYEEQEIVVSEDSKEKSRDNGMER